MNDPATVMLTNRAIAANALVDFLGDWANCNCVINKKNPITAIK